MSNNKNLPARILLVGALATGAHLLHDLGESSHQRQLEAVTTALSSGNLRADLVVGGDRVISLNTPSDSDLKEIAEIAVKGRRNIGNSEFPKYEQSSVVLKIANGQQVCSIRIESRVLSDLLNAARAATSTTETVSLDSLARACNMSPSKLQQSIRVSFNRDMFEQGSGDSAGQELPNSTVSERESQKRVIPSSSRKV